MNILNKNNKLNHRYSYDELIIKKGIFMLPNSLLILNDSSKIIFRDTNNNTDEDINLKIINLVHGGLSNLSFLPESSIIPSKDTQLVNKLYIDNLIKTNILLFTQQFEELDEKINEVVIEINNKVAIKNENNSFTESNDFSNLYLTFEPTDENHATRKSYVDSYVDTKINKTGFISTCEAEGLLEENSYPFCFGNGSLSNENFGLPVPFSYTLRGIAWSIYLTDTTEPVIYIELIHYPSDGSTSTILYTNSEENKLTGKTGEKQNINIASNSAGNLVVKVISSSGITDVNSKFRLSFVLTFDDNIYG